ncbi:MAG: SWIM zinc finger family protein [Desulfovibrionaceae bacterium]|nr:SWIM zinc finger family protein [Desulfovibrionaceae bacterium]
MSTIFDAEPDPAGMLRDFIQDTVPEYFLDEAKSLAGEENSFKAQIKSDGGYYEATGNMQDDDFQVYYPKISIALAERAVSHTCNCSDDSFASPCLHISALALRAENMLGGGDRNEPTSELAPNTEWRQSFRNFFTAEIEPESGKHYLVFRFFPEPDRLQVEFFRARQNKSGLSNVHNEVTLEQILENPSWCELSPDFPAVGALIGRHMDYSGHRVNIPDGLLTWFFWSVRNEYYLF